MEHPPPPANAPESAMAGLPDPFRFADGTRVATRADWARRREEIKDLLLRHQYGRMPPAPERITALETAREDVLDGAGVQRKVTLTMGPPVLTMRLTLTTPPGDGPFPVIVRNVRDTAIRPTSPATIAMVVRRGYGLAEYLCSDLQADETDVPGPARRAYPDHDWGTLAVWAWGGMRVADYLLTRPDVEAGKLVVTGHSRGGKTALLTGALDDRFAVTVPNAGGGGGFQLWRFPMRPEDPPGVYRHENLDLMSKRRTYWFHPALLAFEGKADALPFDQHFLAALVAPRALCPVEAMDDECATPICVQRSLLATREVYAWLGAADRLALYMRQSGGHAQGEEDWTALLDFADWQLFGKEPATRARFRALPYPDAWTGFDW